MMINFNNIIFCYFQGSPELLEVKMGTESFSNSGNEASDDQRRSDNDEVRFIQSSMIIHDSNNDLIYSSFRT